MKQIKFLLKPVEAADALIPTRFKNLQRGQNWQPGTGNCFEIRAIRGKQFLRG